MIENQLKLIETDSNQYNFKSLKDKIFKLMKSNSELENELKKVQELENRNSHLGKVKG